ncbi:hypothetical protein A2U01_0074051, partial [Trifolium medium]|nr:hypothetical protein [Trifolium medium]
VEKTTQGTIVLEGRNDILTAALGTNERPGRVRTAPRGVGFKKFYGRVARPTSGGVSLHHLHTLQQKMQMDFQQQLQKELQQQRVELQQQMQMELQQE